jgi:hypothetical protein
VDDFETSTAFYIILVYVIIMIAWFECISACRRQALRVLAHLKQKHVPGGEEDCDKRDATTIFASIQRAKDNAMIKDMTRTLSTRLPRLSKCEF